MNSSFKRLLAFALAVVMVMSYGVMPVSADENTEGEGTVTCTHEGTETTETVVAATCVTAGSKTVVCACGATISTEEIAATGEHSYGEDGKCECGAEKPEEHSHSYDEVVSDTATCTEGGVKITKCSCGATQEVESPAKGHSMGDGVVTTDPTCAASGVLTKTCDCGETATEVIPATGNHNYVDGVCTGCSAVEPSQPQHTHEWNEGVVTTEAVCTDTGVMTYTCQTEGCGETKTETIPAQCTDEVHAWECPYNLENPANRCTITEGCQLLKGHELLGAPCDTGVPMAEVAKIGDVGYATLQDAFKAATSGATIDIIADVTIAEKWDNRNTGAKFAVPVTINGNGKTIYFTGLISDGYNYMSAFRFEAAATVKNLTIDMSQASSDWGGRIRAISAKDDLTVENCTFIGNGSQNNTRAIIFGEGSGTAIGDVEVNIAGSTFTNWRRGLGDNENGGDAKTVTATGNSFDNASVVISAADSVTFNNNNVSGAENSTGVSIYSNTSNTDMEVTATGNTLEAGLVYEMKNGTPVNVQEEIAVLPWGTLTNAYTSADRYWGECGGNAKKSFVFKFYNDDTYMGYTSLNNVNGIIDGDVNVTWNMKFDTASNTDEYWTMAWDGAAPSVSLQPNRVEQWVDDVKVAECQIEANGPDNLNKLVAAIANKNGNIVGYAKTLAEALNTAKDGETVILLSGSTPISSAGSVAGGKTVTITGEAVFDWTQGNLMIGRGGEGNGTLIFDNATITSSVKKNPASTGIHVSGSKSSENTTNNGTLIIRNSNIETDYLINRNETIVESGSLTVFGGCWTHGRNASESADGSNKTAVLTINSGASVIVINENGMGVGGESNGIMNVAGTYTADVLNIAPNNGATGTVNINGGTVNIAGNVANNSTININGGNLTVGGTLTNDGEVNVNSGESTLNIATNTGKEINLRDGAIIKDSTVGGDGYVKGNVIFRGENTFNTLYDFGTYYAPEIHAWTVEAGASLTLTHSTPSSLYGLGYGDKVTINGSLQDALTARGTVGNSSFSSEKGIRLSTSAGNDAANGSFFTVNNAYAVIGISGTFSNSKTAGKFTIALNNSVIDAAQIYFSDSGDIIDLSITGSDVQTGIFMTADTNSVYKVTNSKLVATATGNDRYNGNNGNLTVKNSTIEIQKGTYTNYGTIILSEGSKLTAPQVVNTADGAKIQIDGSAGYKDGDVVIDVTTAFAEETFKNIEVINNDAMKAVINADGDIALESAVAQVDNDYYYDLQDAIDNASGKTVKLLIDVTPDAAINVDKSTILDLDGKTITGNVVVSAADGATIKNGEIKGTLTVSGKLAVGLDSNLTVGTLTGNGKIEVDATKLSDTPAVILTYDSLNFLPANVTVNKAAGEKEIVDIVPMTEDQKNVIKVAKLPLPTATVTPIANENMTFALNFKADDVTPEQMAYFGEWFADFELKLNKAATFNANSNTADGYLSGQFDSWDDDWVNVPFDDVDMDANTPLRIMKYASENIHPGLKLHFWEVFSGVESFNCGVSFSEEYLNANPDLKVTLELKMYNPANEEESYVIGKTYEFEAPYEAFIDSDEDGVWDEGETKFATIEDAIKAAEKNAAESGDENTTVVIVNDYEKKDIAVPSDITVTVNGADIQIPDGGKVSLAENGTATFTPNFLEDEGYGRVNVTDNKGKTRYFYLDSKVGFTVAVDGKLNDDDKHIIEGNKNGPTYRIHTEQNNLHDYEHYINKDPNMIVYCNGFYDSIDKIWITGGQYGSNRLYIYENAKEKVDNIEVDPGCTIVTLKKDYLNDLDVDDDYYIHFKYMNHGENDSVSVRLKVLAVSSSSSYADPTNYKTGDSIFMAVSIMTFSAAALAVLLIGKKKYA